MSSSNITIHIGDIIQESQFEARVLCIQGDIIYVCLMNTTKLCINTLSLLDVVDRINTGDMLLSDDSSSQIVDVALLNGFEREVYARNKAIVDAVSKEYGPRFIGLMGKSSKPTINRLVSEYDISLNTVWRVIRKYLQSGCKYNSLLPEKRSIAPHAYSKKTGNPGKYGVVTQVTVDEETKKNFDEALGYYKSGRDKSLKIAWDKMNNLHYSTSVLLPDGSYQTGTLLPVTMRPSLRQFTYYCSKHLTQEEKDRIKTSAMESRNNKRLLLGSSRTGVSGPGDYLEADALEVDLSLVSLEDAGRAVARPIVYAMRDVYTMAIVAISVGYDNNSVIGLTNVMLNLCDDKIEYCARYGIELPDAKLWPSDFIPGHIRVDRGSDFKSKEFERICNELNITRELVSGGTGSLKGTIEQFFHQIHSRINPHTEDNGLIEKRFDSNHHKEAVLNITQFTRMLIQCVIQYNQRHMDEYTVTKDMIDKHIDPTPVLLWQYGCENFGSPVPITDRKQYLYTLMRSGKAKISRKGIKFKDLYYINSDDRSLLDTMYRIQNKSLNMDIRYDPRDASYIYYQDNGIMKQASLIEGIPGNADYKGMTFKEVDDYHFQKKLMDHDAQQRNDQIDADTFAVIDAEVKNAARSHTHYNNTSNIRETREAEKQAISRANSITKRLEQGANNESASPVSTSTGTVKNANTASVIPDTHVVSKKKPKPNAGQNNASSGAIVPDADAGEPKDDAGKSNPSTKTVTQDEYFKHLMDFEDKF